MDHDEARRPLRPLPQSRDIPACTIRKRSPAWQEQLPKIDYLYFLDGGLADNLAIHGLLETISSPYAAPIIAGQDSGLNDSNTILDAVNTGKIKKLAVIVINARADARQYHLSDRLASRHRGNDRERDIGSDRLHHGQRELADGGPPRPVERRGRGRRRHSSIRGAQGLRGPGRLRPAAGQRPRPARIARQGQCHIRRYGRSPRRIAKSSSRPGRFFFISIRAFSDSSWTWTSRRSSSIRFSRRRGVARPQTDERTRCVRHHPVGCSSPGLRIILSTSAMCCSSRVICSRAYSSSHTLLSTTSASRL